MPTDTSIKPDVYMVSPAIMKQLEDLAESKRIGDLLTPAVYTCETCGAKISGEIPFKMHNDFKCPGKTPKNGSSAQPPVQAPPPPPEELIRLLRAKRKKAE